MKGKGLLALGLGFCVSVLFSACGGEKKEQKTSAAQTVAKEYDVLEVKLQDRTINTSYSASIKGKQDIDIYPQISGTLTQVSVTEGQRVSQGQTLFVIDQVPYLAAQRTAEANVESAKAQLATAQLQYESKQELFKKDVISEFELATSKNALMAAKAALAQVEAQEVNAKNNLSYTVVKSPSNGVIGTLPYRKGALVSAGMAHPLTTVSDNSTMYVYFSLNENQMLALARQYGSQEKALKNMPDVQLQLGDKSMYEHKGKIESISGVIDQATGTVSIRAVFPNKDGLLRSGGSGNVIIPSVRKGVLVIPVKATFELQDKKFVYKYIDGAARSHEVQVTAVDGGKEYIVENGMKEGDIIITEGVGLLREGTPVKAKGIATEIASSEVETEASADETEKK